MELRATATLGADGTPIQVIERFRPTFEAKLSERVALVTTIEAWLAQGRTTQAVFEDTLNASDLGPLLDAAGCEWPRHDNEFLGVSGPHHYLAVDRLYLDWYHPSFDLRVGRQAIQWGSAQFINPTDPFPQVLFTEPWKPRAGLNTARVTIPFGGSHDIGLIAGIDDTLRYPLASARLRFTAANTDWALVGAYRGDAQDGIVGVDIRGTLGVGFWVESALHIENKPWLEVAVGIDYSFSVLDGLFLVAQYYRNGNGSPDGTGGGFTGNITDSIMGPDCGPGFDSPFDTEPERSYSPPLSGRDYALVGMSLNAMPELALNGFWLQNFDGTAFIIPTVIFKPLGWFDISLAAQLPVKIWGDGGEFRPADDDLVVDIPVGPTTIPIDFSGMVPDATVVLWTRANF